MAGFLRKSPGLVPPAMVELTRRCLRQAGSGLPVCCGTQPAETGTYRRITVSPISSRRIAGVSPKKGSLPGARSQVPEEEVS